ncbi:RrF2 family transcriptional regulator [Pseudomonas sp. LRF_L74]|uniref:RrF2 family transcriptional regulator n=1 Tax=Pseudomonas sp. LRF_L74 TaxID=3369422 RepID=UPI003F5E8EE7
MISQRSRLALKASLYLARSPAGAPVAITDIAAALSASRKFLETILLELKRGGLLTSVRGKNGGYMLARAATDISFGAVIRITDGPLALVPCVSKNFYRPCYDCHDEATCVLRRVMAQARDQVSSVLDGTSLADAIARPEALSGAGILLTPPAPADEEPA